MSQASAGNKIAIHYTGTLADGSVFDSSEGRDPLSFTMGEGQIIPGLETALDGMAEGEEKTVTVPADDAYGQKNPQAMQRVPRSSVPDGIPLDLGTQLQLQTPEGQAMPVTVAEVTESEVVLDANHPLAGKDLTFAVKVVSVD
ncbi:FKBP-type peptidyl-prolyl cis-trans isomerase [Alterinioella nitratireducens]|uniref:FKBP-type peptidyl-prolyl cis-trans isomerase n=1 Tax=Alterinioella nitratireducens TaxID=2735915 RepID=UPI000C8F8B89|nr:peptidylprolyl isomerase [Alterinioella nitratireducens]MAN16139.1 peptidylprolyl isomerase [Dinoroseobacter sp.]NPD20367.1 peptidylprolyl isomerase [Alterinioella nitratireducens]